MNMCEMFGVISLALKEDNSAILVCCPRDLPYSRAGREQLDKHYHTLSHW